MMSGVGLWAASADLHADSLLVQPRIGGDLEREVGVVALLVFFRDELLRVDVKTDVLPERDGGGAARFDLGRLELGEILELAARLRGCRLRAPVCAITRLARSSNGAAAAERRPSRSSFRRDSPRVSSRCV